MYILALNPTKEAIRLGGGLKKLILRNNDKSSETHYKLLLMASTRLDMSHIESCINSMRNNDFKNKKTYLERKRCITSITSFNA